MGGNVLFVHGAPSAGSQNPSPRPFLLSSSEITLWSRSKFLHGVIPAHLLPDNARVDWTQPPHHFCQLLQNFSCNPVFKYHIRVLATAIDLARFYRLRLDPEVSFFKPDISVLRGCTSEPRLAALCTTLNPSSPVSASTKYENNLPMGAAFLLHIEDEVVKLDETYGLNHCYVTVRPSPKIVYRDLKAVANAWDYWAKAAGKGYESTMEYAYMMCHLRDKQEEVIRAKESFFTQQNFKFFPDPREQERSLKRRIHKENCKPAGMGMDSGQFRCISPSKRFKSWNHLEQVSGNSASSKQLDQERLEADSERLSNNQDVLERNDKAQRPTLQDRNGFKYGWLQTRNQKL